MIEGVPIGALINGVGVVGVVIIVGWMVATGRLVTRREHADAIHDRDEWRAECRIKDQQIAEKDAQLRHMAEVGRTVDAIMRSIQRGSAAPEGEQ